MMESLIILALLAGQATDEAPRAAGGIVAIVGTDVITRTEVDRTVDRRITELRLQGYDPVVLERQRSYVERQIVDEMIDNLLLLQEAKRKLGSRSVEELIPDQKVLEEVDRRLANMRKAGHSNMTRDDYFDLQEKDFGRKRSEVFQELRETILVQSFLWEDLFNRMDRFVSPRESRAYYRAHLKEFSTPKQVSFRQIVFQADFRTTERVAEIQRRLAAGEDFVDVARDFDQEYESNPELRGQLWKKSFEELEEWGAPYPSIVKDLRAGQYGGPYQYRNRFIFFVKIEDMVEGEPLSYEEAQPQIERRLLAERHEIQMRRHLEALRERAGIELLEVPVGVTTRDEPPGSGGAEAGESGGSSEGGSSSSGGESGSEADGEGPAEERPSEP